MDEVLTMKGEPAIIGEKSYVTLLKKVNRHEAWVVVTNNEMAQKTFILISFMGGWNIVYYVT